ncbi:translation initiation factor IF-2-like [Parus major]|uniref:translation initiation factor IF-2-like n=1 Tax=Parus major TaxID=9157 RepID=UPI00144432EA|nr:translation initiation factor IF-2-like [Parus major]
MPRRHPSPAQRREPIPAGHGSPRTAAGAFISHQPNKGSRTKSLVPRLPLHQVDYLPWKTKPTKAKPRRSSLASSDLGRMSPAHPGQRLCSPAGTRQNRGEHPDKEGEASGDERDREGAPSLSAAGSLPSRAARGDPTAPTRQTCEGTGGGGVDGGGGGTNSLKSSPKNGHGCEQLSRLQPRLCVPERDPFPSPRGPAAPVHPRGPGGLPSPRGTALPPHSPPPPAAAARASRSPPPARLQERRRPREPPPAAAPAPRRGRGTPAGGMVRSPQAGVAGAGRAKGSRDGGRRDGAGGGRARTGNGHGDIPGGAAVELFTIHKYESPSNFLPARLARQTGRRWQGAGPVCRAWGWGALYLRPPSISSSSSSSSPGKPRVGGGCPPPSRSRSGAGFPPFPGWGAPATHPAQGHTLLLPLPEVSRN